MPNMSIANPQQRARQRRPRRIAPCLLILTLLAAVVLSGCGDDDDTFEGADIFELQNTTWAFSDLRVFNLGLPPNPPQAGTLVIGMFGSSQLSDDEAPFTLTVAGPTNTGTATGTVDLDEGDNPFGEDFSRCRFQVDTSDIAPLPPQSGLTAGDVTPTDCVVTRDGTELQLTNRNTDRVSIGTLQVQ